MKMDKHVKKAVADLKAIFDMDVEGDPYLIYQEIEAVKDEIPDKHEYLAVQEHALHTICSDLAEHGDTNLYFYAKGKIPKATFDQLYKKVFGLLIEELKKSKATKTEVWAVFGRVPLRIKQALG